MEKEKDIVNCFGFINFEIDFFRLQSFKIKYFTFLYSNPHVILCLSSP